MQRRRLGIVAAAGAAALLPGLASAHGDEAVSGAFPRALGEWSLDPVGFVGVGVIVGLYGWGYWRLRRVAPRFHFPRWHLWAFGASAFLILLATVSPIDNYDDDLFWVHMTQHMILVMLAAPLLLLGAPVTLALRAASPRVRRAVLVPLLESRVAQALTRPYVAAPLFTLSVWLWHIPSAYDAAVRHDLLHIAEHTSFMAGAILFWWLIIGVDANRLRPGHVGRVAFLVVQLLTNLALALILTNVGEPLYSVYDDPARTWGPSPLTDQRIGAGIMWVPGSMMFLLAILSTVYYWAEHEDFKGRRGDQLRELAKRPATPAGRSD